MTDTRNTIDTGKIRAKLQALRTELLALIEGSRDSRSAVELDQTKVGRLSRIDALQGQQMALATDRRRELELRRIDSALERLEAGDYGHCLRCDEPIAPRRLELDPAAPLCVDCASED